VLHHDLEGRVILLSCHNLRSFRLRSTKLAQSHQRPP
jgi:hypothetical protein